MRRKTAVIWIVLSLFCLSACQQTADSSLTDTSIQTEDTVEEASGSSHITTETPSKNDTTVLNTSDTTSSDTAITGTTISHPVPRTILFSSLDELQQFMTSFDEKELRNALSMEFSSGNVHFEKSRFTMLLEDHFYLMPVLPDSYRFSGAEINALGTMTLEYTDANNNYFGVSLFLNKDKASYKTTERFVKSDGKEVQVAIYLPESGAGVYSWEEESYQCIIGFSKENMSMTRTFVNNLRMEKIMIA